MVKPSAAEQARLNEQTLQEFEQHNRVFADILQQLATLAVSYDSSYQKVRGDAAEKVWADDRFTAMITDAKNTIGKLDEGPAGIIQSGIEGLGYTKNVI